MPLSFKASEAFLATPASVEGDVFVIFYASVDPATGEMWCGDCRKVEAIILRAFEPPGRDGYVLYVGQRSEWKAPSNAYRKTWGLTAVPTIISFKDGKEVGRIVEDDILDTEKFTAFLEG